MGAKNPANNKETNITSKKCEECQKEFQTLSGLKSHTMYKHPEKFKQDTDSENEEDGKDSAPPSYRTSKRLKKQQQNSTEHHIVHVDTNSEEPASILKTQTVFECPKCTKIFHVYFSAHKHIQKRHYEDDNGKLIPADKLQALKPIRKEMCTICEEICDEDHTCIEDLSKPDDDPYLVGGYHCLGCRRHYTSIGLFDSHVAGTHSDSVDSMFFENETDFDLWRSTMESQIKMKYLRLRNTSSRQYYHCNYVSPKNSADITHLCPSILVVIEFPKGIQVHYYKKHYEHSCAYVIPSQFQSNLLNTLTATTPEYSKTSSKGEVDLYKKFKTLINKVIVESAKINVTNLNKLYKMALEMHNFVKSYDEEYEETNTDLNVQSNLSGSGTPVKTIKVNPLNVNEKKTKETKLNESNNKIINRKDSPEEKLQKGECLQKSLEKVVESINTMTDDQISEALEVPRVSTRSKRKSINLNPISKQPQIISEEKSNPTPKKAKLEPVEAKKTNFSLKENNSLTKDPKLHSPKIVKPPAINQSPSFNDSYKQFIDSTLNVPSGKKEVVKRSHPKKEVVKTKIGQFIPSPKKATTTLNSENIEDVKKKKKASIKSPQTQTSIAKIEIKDIKYKVVEQENDCNILVLKI